MLINAAQLYIDLHRTPIDEELISGFKHQANIIGLQAAKERMFEGEHVNRSEDQAAHHVALRDPDSDHPHAKTAREILEKVVGLAGDIRDGKWKGATGKPIERVINIGIGGSDLGPRMICAALAKRSETPAVSFVANIDPAEMDEALTGLDQETTLFIVASKSFNTLETLENGLAARHWLCEKIAEQDLEKHLVAITANVQRAIDYGVAAQNILPMWDWVGGRYSLWSAIGLPIAIAIGEQKYRALLNGAHQMDQHFRQTKLNQNAPTLLAMLEAHYQRNLKITSLAVLPYSYQLRLLPDYLQQLCMESNGKSVKADGEPVAEETSGILWGSAGTVGQHSFHQLLHQGTSKFAIDFILPLNGNTESEAAAERHQHLVANCLAQSQAFANGKNFEAALKEVTAQGLQGQAAEILARQKVISGNKPNTLIGMDCVCAESLGALIALYEHKTFVLSVIWGINPFDQWGVELGKQLSGPIFSAMNSSETDTLSSTIDSHSLRWIERFRAVQCEKTS